MRDAPARCGYAKKVDTTNNKDSNDNNNNENYNNKTNNGFNNDINSNNSVMNNKHHDKHYDNDNDSNVAMISEGRCNDNGAFIDKSGCHKIVTRTAITDVVKKAIKDGDEEEEDGAAGGGGDDDDDDDDDNDDDDVTNVGPVGKNEVPGRNNYENENEDDDDGNPCYGGDEVINGDNFNGREISENGGFAEDGGEMCGWMRG